jgi:hypothetical protein
VYTGAPEPHVWDGAYRSKVIDPPGEEPPLKVAESLRVAAPTVPPAPGVVLKVNDATDVAGLPQTT